MKENLTLLQSFKAMYFYLDNYYFQMNKPDEIGVLLGDLRLLADGRLVDPAAWNDWLEAVQKVLETEKPSDSEITSN